MIISPAIIQGCHRNPAEIERPEKIVSKREVYYDSATYANLAHLWGKYYEAYPSEDSYANWMYATRYASLPDYESSLKKGFDQYPANPVLLYLSGMRKHGAVNNLEGRQLLEGRAIEDEIMDYSYNMLASLDRNAVIITNGDNDTYPGWILTRILRMRPDVNIVNRYLLSSEWYPTWIMNEGVPTFITKSGLEKLRNDIFEDIKAKKIPFPGGGIYGDTLIVLLTDAAKAAGRPVYFSATMDATPMVDRYKSQGRILGLVTLVTPAAKPYPVQLRNLFSVWVSDFRTGGLECWRLRRT